MLTGMACHPMAAAIPRTSRNSVVFAKGAVDSCLWLARVLMSYDPCGRDRLSDAEGATAPETLRPKDRRELTLWKVMGFFPIHRRK